MSAKPLPKGYRLSTTVDKAFCLSDDYRHWTVADLIEILSEYPQGARVWFVSGRTLHPVELVSECEGEVFL